MAFLNRTIVLVGLMGSGKSRIGARLAKLMHLPFIDSDREIEAASNHTIPEIFEKFGEKEFRLGERQVMQRLLSSDAPRVVASGGGAFIQPEVRDLIKNKAISVWLKTDIKILVERVGRNNNRPMLKNSDPAVKLRQLMEDRYPIYAEADITIVTDGQTPHDVARNIKKEVERLSDKKKQ